MGASPGWSCGKSACTCEKDDAVGDASCSRQLSRPDNTSCSSGLPSRYSINADGKKHNFPKQSSAHLGTPFASVDDPVKIAGSDYERWEQEKNDFNERMKQEQKQMQDNVRQFALLAKEGIECEVVGRRGYSPAIFKLDSRPERIVVEGLRQALVEVPFDCLAAVYRFEDMMAILVESSRFEDLKSKAVMPEDWERIAVFVYAPRLKQNPICLVTANVNARERFVTCMKVLLLSYRSRIIPSDADKNGKGAPQQTFKRPSVPRSDTIGKGRRPVTASQDKFTTPESASTSKDELATPESDGIKMGEHTDQTDTRHSLRDGDAEIRRLATAAKNKQCHLPEGDGGLSPGVKVEEEDEGLSDHSFENSDLVEL